MTTAPITAAELAVRLDCARRAEQAAEQQLQHSRHRAFLGEDGADAAEAAAEHTLAEAQRQVARLESALTEQQQLEGVEARAEHRRGLETQEALFLEHLAAAEAAGETLEKALATYVKGFQQYTQAAIAVQQMAPALGERIRHDFTLDRPETLIGDELARISSGGRHPPGTSLHALQSQGDPTRLPRISERIVALTGEWRSNIEAARAART
jgi:hypothetical protein